jgi:hypothetical protein
MKTELSVGGSLEKILEDIHETVMSVMSLPQSLKDISSSWLDHRSPITTSGKKMGLDSQTPLLPTKRILSHNPLCRGWGRGGGGEIA